MTLARWKRAKSRLLRTQHFTRASSDTFARCSAVHVNGLATPAMLAGSASHPLKKEFQHPCVFVQGSRDLPVFRLPAPKLAVQRRYNLNLFLGVLTGSLQGVAERPLPCNYNVIQQNIALSRRRRGFKSRRGRQINNLREKCLLSV